MPTLDGLGAVGGGAHADNEHILLDELLPRTGLLVGLIQEVLHIGTAGAPTAAGDRS